MKGFKNFNRHDLFTIEDHDTVRDVIDQVDFLTSNELYGLFDGYLYDGLIKRVEEAGGSNLQALKELVDRIEKHINVHGETMTAIF
jgi:hypothetical protein